MTEEYVKDLYADGKTYAQRAVVFSKYNSR